eukprot:TRINITY_DN21244_c0_g2_i1.p1 TRINITY_DN21244_c0_g2~~TRINITY_DN21244_c0_g2_i1.p1  ORF type:complete len:679 (+),score=82.70 TRINITY_DN21244_c0_g2_i1:1-2037(+)
MPFPTVAEGVVRGELVTEDCLIVRKTTEQIRPVSLFISEMMSHETFELLAKGNSVFFSPRTDFVYARSRFRELADEMLRNTDLRLGPFDLAVPEPFFESVKRPLVNWVATSADVETIPALLRTFEAQRQVHFEHRNMPPTLTPQSGWYSGVVEVEMHLSELATQPGRIIQYSINKNEVTELYTVPIKLLPGEHVIRSKVVGLPLSDSITVRHTFYVSVPADGQTLLTIFICLSSCLGLTLITFVFRGAQLLSRLFAERRQRERFKKLANERMAIDAYKSAKQLEFPLVLIRADRFLALSNLAPFETVVTAANLILLHSFQHVAVFKLSRKMVFLSHQWLGFHQPDPDNLQLVAMKNAVGRAVEMLSMDSHNVYVWIDYICIPQVTEVLQDMAIKSLVSYISLCDLFIIVAPGCVHSDSGSHCDDVTYRSRGWCRMELFTKILTTGREHIFIARSDFDALETFKEVDICVLKVLEGDFACCSRNHIGTRRCDKEKLQLALLGLYMHLLVSDETGWIGCITTLNRQVCREVMSNADTFFPRSFEIRWISDHDVMTDARGLLEDRLSLCRDQFRLPFQILVDASEATLSRKLTWVPGTYKILCLVSVYATPELEEQDDASPQLRRGCTVKIVSVREASIENSIIGKVENPSGWIRLSTTESHVCWAALIEEAEDYCDSLTV